MMLAPSPYDQAADTIQQLGTLTLEARQRLHMSFATQAKQIGITSTTLTSLEGGANSSRNTVVLVLRWLATH